MTSGRPAVITAGRRATMHAAGLAADEAAEREEE
jgi:hypothetical protein